MEATVAALAAMTLWGIAPVLGKLGLVGADPWLGLLVRNSAALLFLFLGLLTSGRLGGIGQLPPRGAALLVAEGVLASLLAQLAYYWALKQGEASRVVPVTAAYPLITLVLAVGLLGERLSWAKLGGAVLVVAGLLLLRH